MMTTTLMVAALVVAGTFTIENVRVEIGDGTVVEAARARPAIINAVKTGPNSRTSERATSCPVRFTAPKDFRDLAD